LGFCGDFCGGFDRNYPLDAHTGAEMIIQIKVGDETYYVCDTTDENRFVRAQRLYGDFEVIEDQSQEQWLEEMMAWKKR